MIYIGLCKLGFEMIISNEYLLMKPMYRFCRYKIKFYGSFHLYNSRHSPLNLYHLGYSELKQRSPTYNHSKLSIAEPVSSDSLVIGEWESWTDKLGVPYFVPNQTHQVLAPLGHTTYLHCIVGNLGDRQVNNVVK